MMYADLQEFLKALEREGELLRVCAGSGRGMEGEWSPILEITELADVQSKMKCAKESATAKGFDAGHAGLGGKAILIEDVEGCDFPLAINVFGSYRRMEMALGCEASGGFEAIAKKIETMVKPSAPPSLWNVREVWKKAKMFLPLLRIAPRRVRSGKCQEVVKLTERGEVDLRRLPLIKCWPADGDPRMVGVDVSPEDAGTAGGEGRYITFAGMHTVHYEDRGKEKPASHNIGMYRAQLLDATRLAMHWHIHHDGAAHWRSWKKAAPAPSSMPIAICFGGEAVLPYAATAPLPAGMSELLMAGFLNGRGIPMVKAKTVPLRVPANSEIVIEGYVSTECGMPGWEPGSGETVGNGAVFEGPFGDHTGFYSLPDRYPVMTVTAVTHRRDAVFPATVVGIPPQEDYYMGKATERVFLPLLRMLIPDIVDYHLPMFGCFHNCAFIKIRKAYPLQARRVMHAVWGAGQMAWTKMVMVVDEEVDVHDEEAVMSAMMRECDFERDVELVRGPMDILDHAAPWLGAGSKIGFDCTRKVAGEGERLKQVEVKEDSIARVRAMYGERVGAPGFGGGSCLFTKMKKERGGAGAEAIAHIWGNAPQDTGRFVVVVDEAVDMSDWQSVMFHLCANCDPMRDVHWLKGRMAFDATKKMKGDERNGMPVRQYPPLITMSEEIKERVRKRMESARSS